MRPMPPSAPGLGVSSPRGEIWARIDGNSLVGFQALIEKGVASWLWSDAALPVLLGPAWAIPLVPAVLLLWLARRRRPRGGFSR